MAYNFKEIGKRIEENRRQLGMKSATALSEAIEEQGPYYSRQMVRDWETGKKVPPEKAQLILCNLFNCDLGYLLCEYDCKTRTNTDIAEETGLSESSINHIQRICRENSRLSSALNFLLESRTLEDILIDFYEYENRRLHCSMAREEMDSAETDEEYYDREETFLADQDSMISWEYRIGRSLDKIIDAWEEEIDSSTPEERIKKIQSFIPYAV